MIIYKRKLSGFSSIAPTKLVVICVLPTPEKVSLASCVCTLATKTLQTCIIMPFIFTQWNSFILCVHPRGRMLGQAINSQLIEIKFHLRRFFQSERAVLTINSEFGSRIYLGAQVWFVGPFSAKN